MTSWKNKTCEDCEYRDGDRCRRLPPFIKPEFVRFNAWYPQVRQDGKLSQVACAEYRPKEER